MNKIKLVKWSAQWCGPCKALNPVWLDVKNQYVDNPNVELVSYDVDDENDPSPKDYGVKSVPTIIFLSNDKEVHRTTGMVSKDIIKSKITELLNQT